MNDLKGAVAVITGAATGIGKGIAVSLASQGVVVGINHWNQAAGAEDTLAHVRERGGEGMILPADVRDRAELARSAEIMAKTWGRLDIWVNNAAVQPNRSLWDYDEALLERVMDTNVKGYLWGIQVASALMAPRGYGRIINISSVHGKRPSAFDPVYAMSKGALKMLVREAAVELGSLGITVNAVEPGAVYVGGKGNPQLVEALPPTELGVRRRRFPLGRVGLPEDIGRVVAFLASPQSDYINGAALRVDGGSMLL
ncbi:MAG: SDR family NAD(P)-dependent oxidoreductase [Thermaerobacter sp.]|nr:SDR family NAD(P)-dependent oxidoreductase [Thermaerobacter sp.]